MDISRPSLAQSITCVALLGEMTFTVYLACFQHCLHLPRRLEATSSPGLDTAPPGGRGGSAASITRIPGPHAQESRVTCHQAEPENQSSGRCEISQPNLPVSEKGKPEFRGATSVTAEERQA